MFLIKKELKERLQYQPSNMEEVIEASNNFYKTGEEVWCWNNKKWVQIRCVLDGYSVLSMNGFDNPPSKKLKEIPLERFIIVKYRGGFKTLGFDD